MASAPIDQERRAGDDMVEGEESVGDSFPEIMLAANALPSDACLDGEILAWGKDGLRSFSRLQRRLGRKTPGPGILKKEPVRFQAYDLLRLDGVDFRELPLSDRRKKLENVVEALPGDFQLGLSPLVLEESWSALSDLHAQSRDRGVEGFMLKRKNSNYKSGRVKEIVINGRLILYMQHEWWRNLAGASVELYSDYSLAVWSDSQELVVVAKAYSGLSARS